MNGAQKYTFEERGEDLAPLAKTTKKIQVDHTQHMFGGTLRGIARYGETKVKALPKV
jgi:hypothetical protein